MRAARIDRNQTEIVKGLRDRGYSVFSTARVGHGFPDLVVGAGGINYLLEVKAGPAEKLTPRQEEFFEDWQGRARVVCSLEEALKEIGAL